MLEGHGYGVQMGDLILVCKTPHGSLEGAQWRNFFQMADASEAEERTTEA